MADVPYRPGDIRGDWGDPIYPILVWCSMHTLGILLRMVARSVVTICHCRSDKGVVVAESGGVAVGTPVGSVVVPVSGY